MQTTTCVDGVDIRPATTLARVTVLAVLLALAACNRGDDRSAGEKVDAAIARTQQAAVEARQRTEALAEDAREKLKSSEPAMRQGLDNVKGAAREAGAAVSVGVEDASITATVSASLARDAELSAARIDVDTDKGAVTLQGPAPSADARARAERLTREVKGVTSVDNRLVVQAM